MRRFLLLFRLRRLTLSRRACWWFCLSRLGLRLRLTRSSVVLWLRLTRRLSLSRLGLRLCTFRLRLRTTWLLRRRTRTLGRLVMRVLARLLLIFRRTRCVLLWSLWWLSVLRRARNVLLFSRLLLLPSLLLLTGLLVLSCLLLLSRLLLLLSLLLTGVGVASLRLLRDEQLASWSTRIATTAVPATSGASATIRHSGFIWDGWWAAERGSPVFTSRRPPRFERGRRRDEAL